MRFRFQMTPMLISVRCFSGYKEVLIGFLGADLPKVNYWTLAFWVKGYIYHRGISIILFGKKINLKKETAYYYTTQYLNDPNKKGVDTEANV